ncbi:hypothetical protein EYR41_004632 [Orbilia oligospora]|uniref:Uncharacterized protein n=1 Tax=Orbilia oligospora TaxID=2813651 RepID=A0A8H2E6Q8_ORBOL|nr:hypothetical protein EYR41_004632 [Orbilia oligospora]
MHKLSKSVLGKVVTASDPTPDWRYCAPLFFISDEHRGIRLVSKIVKQDPYTIFTELRRNDEILTWII